MEKKHISRSIALSSGALHICGLLLLTAGCVGGVIQHKVLGVGQMSNSQLLQILQGRPDGMALATAALVCQTLETCAVPIFAFLLAEGASHTRSYRRYMLRVLGLAVVCEVPYNFLTNGMPLSPGSLNPVFGTVLCMIMLYFFRTFREKKAAHMAIKAVAVLGVFLWSGFLGVAYGGSCVIITAALWMLQGKQNIQMLAGCAISIACSIFSPMYLLSPLAFLAIHFYDGRYGSAGKHIYYLGYPSVLAVCLLLSRLAR